METLIGDEVKNLLSKSKDTWLITGVAGFIGSNLLETLLLEKQNVRGFDNYLTGSKDNLLQVRQKVGEDLWSNFRMFEGDIRNLDNCMKACNGVDYVLHQAALGSVPRSFENPGLTNEINIGGFLNMLIAAKSCHVKVFVYASSSAVYGDQADSPKVEHRIGNLLSPYAVSKRANELYSKMYSLVDGVQTVGLRYFNVFGPRQDPMGAYAAVIPRWIDCLINNKEIFINGDGQISRDFCYVQNVVDANILSALNISKTISGKIFNIAVGESTTLNQLKNLINESICELSSGGEIKDLNVIYREARKGDIQHSLADITKAKKFLNYVPRFNISDGMMQTVKWFMNRKT